METNEGRILRLVGVIDTFRQLRRMDTEEIMELRARVMELRARVKELEDWQDDYRN